MRRATLDRLLTEHIGIISIHALREESDTTYSLEFEMDNGISIHALREESDPEICLLSVSWYYFNPRSP